MKIKKTEPWPLVRLAKRQLCFILTQWANLTKYHWNMERHVWQQPSCSNWKLPITQSSKGLRSRGSMVCRKTTKAASELKWTRKRTEYELTICMQKWLSLFCWSTSFTPTSFDPDCLYFLTFQFGLNQSYRCETFPKRQSQPIWWTFAIQNQVVSVWMKMNQGKVSF